MAAEEELVPDDDGRGVKGFVEFVGSDLFPRGALTMGVPVPFPGTSTFNFTFFSSLHSVTEFPEGDAPEAVGPRH